MKCPICEGIDLVISDRQNVEIDYCPKCRGVWLDRGELDKIIERSAGIAASRAQERYEDSHDDDGRYRDSAQRGQLPKKKKVESFLGELFDF